LGDLYEPKNENMVMELHERLHNSNMAKGEGVVPYLTRLTQIRDEIAAVVEMTEDDELVRVSLNGFTKS